jgi:hypothetical protein
MWLCDDASLWSSLEAMKLEELRRHQEQCTKEDDVMLGKEDGASCRCCCSCWTGGGDLAPINWFGNVEDNRLLLMTVTPLLLLVLAASWTVLRCIAFAESELVADGGDEGIRNKG